MSDSQDITKLVAVSRPNERLIKQCFEKLDGDGSGELTGQVLLHFQICAADGLTLRAASEGVYLSGALENSSLFVELSYVQDWDNINEDAPTRRSRHRHWLKIREFMDVRSRPRQPWLELRSCVLAAGWKRLRQLQRV